MIPIILTFVFVFCGSCSSSPVHINTTKELVILLSNVSGATAATFGAADDMGNAMQSPTFASLRNASTRKPLYLALYHTPYPMPNGTYRFKINVAIADNISSSLQTWRFQRTLIDNADMPKLKLTTSGSLLLVHEQWMREGSHGESMYPCRVGFRFFNSVTDLLEGNHSFLWVAPNYSSSQLDGTPNIYHIVEGKHGSALPAVVVVGFHYWSGTRDTNAAANVSIVNSSFATWSPTTLTQYDDAFIAAGVSGNLGQRDTLVTSSGVRYNLQEGNVGVPGGSWDKWRLWLYTYGKNEGVTPTGEGTITLLNVTTPQDSFSFGNPSVSVVEDPWDETRVGLMISYFVFGEGAGRGESGSLMFYQHL